MRIIRFSLLFFSLVLLLGCSARGDGHLGPQAILSCPTCPCGDRIDAPDMKLVYRIDVDPATGKFLLRGEARPVTPNPGARLDFLVLDVMLTRDLTVTDTYVFTLSGGGEDGPLPFEKTFTPDGGFDGVSFHWDVHYLSD